MVRGAPQSHVRHLSRAAAGAAVCIGDEQQPQLDGSGLRTQRDRMSKRRDDRERERRVDQLDRYSMPPLCDATVTSAWVGIFSVCVSEMSERI